MADVDVVVIGSGAGGLAAAVALARAGKKVVVLEQHYLPGGWCHSFNLGGYRFSPGVHYVGELGPGQRMRAIYEGLGVGRDLVFCELDPDGYDQIRIGHGEHAKLFHFPKGRQALTERLKSRFPGEVRGIDGYLDKIEAMSHELDWVMKSGGLRDFFRLPFAAPTLMRWGLRSARTLIEHCVSDPTLRAVLTAQAGDHGLPPSLAPAGLHGAITAHYFEGGWYPRGGAGGIPAAFIRALRRHGGEIRVNASVERILLEGKRAIGVRLADGSEIRAHEVISNADPAVTLGKLVGVENLGPFSRLRLWRTKWSTSCLSLFLAVDMDLRAAGITSGNVWSYPDDAYERTWGEDWTKREGGEVESLFLSATSLKDPSRRQGGHHVLEAFIGVPFDAFRRWSATKMGERPADYTALKAVLTAKMIKAVGRVIPDVARHVVFAELGTPLTNVHYCASTEGSCYGTEKTAFQIGPFGHQIRTEFAGLRLVGASTLQHGVMGATLSGVFAAKDILGCTYDELLRPDGHQVVLVPAEDVASWPSELRSSRGSRPGDIGATVEEALA